MRSLARAHAGDRGNIHQARPVRWPFDPTRPLPLAITFLSTVILVFGCAFFVQAMRGDTLALRLDRPIRTLVVVSEGERVLAQELSSWPVARSLLRFGAFWTMEKTERQWNALILYFHQTDRHASESTAVVTRDVVLSRWGNEQAWQRVTRLDPTEIENLPSRLQLGSMGFDSETDAKLFVCLATALTIFVVVCFLLGIGIIGIFCDRAGPGVGDSWRR